LHDVVSPSTLAVVPVRVAFVRNAPDEEFSAQTSSSSAAEPRHDFVLAAVAKLKTLDREFLQLVFWDELSHAHAAAVLSCSVNAFERRYRRARNRVRDDVDVSVDVSTRPTASALTDVPLTPKEAAS
jgi:DNA-directed RNA polymerase specialized sigma24 family protein